MDLAFLIIACVRAAKHRGGWGFWIAALVIDCLGVIVYSVEFGSSMILMGVIMVAAMYIPTGIYIRNRAKDAAEPQQTRVCPSCGAAQPAGGNFCRNCGAAMNMTRPAYEAQTPPVQPAAERPLREDEIACPVCGARQAAARSLCYSCGGNLHPAAVNLNKE